MEKLILPNQNATEENILRIIEYVRQVEKSKGLTDEQISYKYTHGDCNCLADLIKTLLPDVKLKGFGSSNGDAHSCVAIKGNPDVDERLDRFIGEDFYYFDINGKKYYDEMCEYLANTFHTDVNKIRVNHHYVVNSLQNETTKSILENGVSIQPKDNRKIYSAENFANLIILPIDDIKRKLVFAGNNLALLNGKSDEELRQMLLNYVTVEQDDFFELTQSKDLEKVNKLVKALDLLNLSPYDLFEKLGFNEPVEKESKTEQVDESQIYLYQTEQLFNSALEEYFSSELPSAEKTKQYISRVILVEKTFRKYAVRTNGFIATERYKKVQDFINTFPRFLPYVYDETKGDFINQQNEKNYYMQIASQLDTLGTPTSSKKM